MNKVLDYLKETHAPLVLDIDGVLSSYNYGEYHAHHEMDRPGALVTALYGLYTKIAKPIPVIQKFIKENYVDTGNIGKVYCLSQEPHGLEEEKRWFVRQYYGIPYENCYFVTAANDKIKVLEEIKILFNSEEKPVYIDDNTSMLRDVEECTHYITAHVTLFFEEDIAKPDVDKAHSPLSSVLKGLGSTANGLLLMFAGYLINHMSTHIVFSIILITLGIMALFGGLLFFASAILIFLSRKYGIVLCEELEEE